MNILITCLIGFLVGSLAAFIMKIKGIPWYIDILVGIGGSWVGNWAAGQLGIGVEGSIPSFICATVGAAAILWVVSLFKKK
ncbi:MAG: GlsB/YeaQ/YmgE family stress response membrane protein [Bacteroidales bacterium]|nr:GlsB/YeaQ/YmgE family stress response membrane protein [Bacteroidales bacterium]